MKRYAKRRSRRRMLHTLGVLIPAAVLLVAVAWVVWNPGPSPSMKRVLDPQQFSGQTRDAYMTAEQYPQLLQYMTCYCGCQNPMHVPYHTSLYECFTDYHGSTCQVCQSEALMAKNLYLQGKTFSEIKSMIDMNFGP